MAGRPGTGKARAKGAIDTLRSGSLRVRVYAGVDPVTGKRHDLVEVVPPGPRAQRQAEAILARFLREICLCSPCHLVTHFGYANVTGRTEQAFAHLRRVTGMDDIQAQAHVRAAENLWIERSARTWTLDLTMLTGAGITVRQPEPASARAAAAEAALGPSS